MSYVPYASSVLCVCGCITDESAVVKIQSMRRGRQARRKVQELRERNEALKDIGKLPLYSLICFF